MEQTYTVFSKNDYAISGENDYSRELSQFIYQFAVEDKDNPPVAWMDGVPSGLWTRYRDASIAAGRTIELIDGNYVPRGVQEDKPKEMFRIGGVYRNGSDIVVRIDPIPEYNLRRIQATHQGPFGWAKSVDINEPCGFVSLESGLTVWALRNGCPDDDEYDLLPGELHQVNGQWVAVEEKPAESFERGARQMLEQMSAGEWTTVGYLQVDEPDPSEVRDLAAINDVRAIPEPARFDRFPGFTVKSNPGPQSEQTKGPLSLSTNTNVVQLPAVCGSAYLVRDR